MSNVACAIKLRLDVDEEAERILDGQSRICNWLYNHLLETANGFREEYRQTQDPEVSKRLYTTYGLRNLVPALKEENPFLKSVHAKPLKNAALRLTDAIQTYQNSRKGKCKGKKTGWPRFRSWKRNWFSLLYCEPWNGYLLKKGQLILSLGMGEERKRRSVTVGAPDGHLLKDAKVKTLRIVKQQGVFYAVFSVEKAVPKTKKLRKVIALDPNHKNLATGVSSRGQSIEIESPWFLKNVDKRIDELKAKRDRCQRKARLVPVLDASGHPTGKQRWQSSRRWLKHNATLERAYAKRRDQTKTFCYTLAHRLCRHYDLIGIGDYTPDGSGKTTAMRRAMNNQSVGGRFKAILEWVALKSGKLVLEFPEHNTTRTCSVCGFVMKSGIPPEVRQWQCPDCGILHLRDENAAQNGMVRTLRIANKMGLEISSGPVPGSGPVPIKERWDWRVRPSGVLSTSRGSSSREKSATASKLYRGRDIPRPKATYTQV